MCNNCKTNKCAGSGNFTYIAYASDTDGSNFSRVRDSNGVSRCFQAIVTTNVALDVNDPTYASNFGGRYYYICNSEDDGECECESGGCKLYPYKKFDGKNVKFIEGHDGTVIYSDDPEVQNQFRIDDAVSLGLEESIWVWDTDLKDDQGNPLQEMVEYYLEFYIPSEEYLPSFGADNIEIKLGDGEFGTAGIMNSQTQVGLNRFIIRASSGESFSASSLVFYFHINSSFKDFLINNIRLGSSACGGPKSNVIAYRDWLIFKAMGNNNKEALEIGDLVQGWWEPSMFWRLAKYTGGDINSDTSYEIYDTMEF